MNDDELKHLWQQQSLRDPALSPAQVMSAMQNKTTQLRRTLLTRDVIELVACVVVCVIFGIYYFTLSDTPMSRLGDLIIIGSSIFIAWKLIHARRSTPSAPSGATVVESLRAELKAVRAQSQLLGSVLWWYLLPIATGIFVSTWGSLGRGFSALVGNILYSIFVIALFLLVYWVNQRARSEQLLPVEAQLESLLRGAETGEPLDETEVANLRPIVLSMAAANGVKPAEFRLSFWQIAFWGEIGFVGIWLFSMIGLAVDQREGRAMPQASQTSAQTIGVEETNRFTLVARKLVDLFNAGDYANVQKLYNPEMSKAFPPKQTSDFFEGIAADFGTIENIEGPTGHGYRGWTAFRLHCQNGELTMSLALDANDKISGYYFQPVEPSASIGLFVRHIFSWQHLLWLPLFFLGGLLYSWLIQKWVGRAVGISALGIHLHKGLNLVLWDEINEVRPFRFLHVRNLWLIRESGKKMLMHWTPLERHSDLKKAVESSAPTGHPIRKYLSLLK